MAMVASTLTTWQVSESEFPTTGNSAEKLRFLINYAVLAPSGHNIQPWRFHLEGDTLSLFADRERALPVVDPADRELTISCGAALFHLRLALHYFGYEGAIATFPEPDNPDLLARIQLGEQHQASPEEKRLFQAITERHTNRLPFQDKAIPDALLATWQAAVESEAAQLQFVTGKEEREAVADLIARGDRIQGADPEFRRELADWIHPNRTRHRDGMPGYAFGIGYFASYFGSFLMRRVNWGTQKAAEDRQVAIAAPLLALLTTETDNPSAWLAVGQALAKLLLHARAEGVWAAFFNQPIEVPSLRSELSQTLNCAGCPQLLLRMGYGQDVKPTPRREASEVLN
jgi:hypothetical protein